MQQRQPANNPETNLLESADVARELDITPAMVRVHASLGRLRVAAFTPRGARLFRRDDVVEFKKTYRRRTSRPEAATAIAKPPTDEKSAALEWLGRK